MEAFDLKSLDEKQAGAGKAYLEFLRVEALSMGIYVLPAGGSDPQRPHTEDEVYFVTRGRATIQVGRESRPVGAGDIIYVPANVDHRFHSIEEELALLVFFAPAEYSLSGTLD